MRLVRLPHACVRLETSEGILVIDPGVFSGPDKLGEADAVFITHQHFDHLDAEALQGLVAARPDVKIYGPPSLAEDLGGTPFTAVRHGDTIHTLGITATVHGEKHAEIHPAIPLIENVGYYIDGLYHPGDSFTVPEFPVRTLLAPIGGPWLKLSEAAAFIDAVAPSVVHPIHDAVLSEPGQSVADRVLGGVTKPEYVRLGPGDHVEL
jgi:L-ascorbate metabolism protein UlaG (beta-lactamase superfamily)